MINQTGITDVRRLSPLLVFFLVAGIGAFISLTVWSNERARNQVRFEAIADEAADRLHRRVQQHIALLIATAAHLAKDGGEITRSDFVDFISRLQLEGRYEGVQGIGFADIVESGEEADIRRHLSQNYGVDRGVWPDSDEDVRTAIMLLEPLDDRNRTALGYDMYTEERRRLAIWRAMQTGEISATQPVTLVQEITPDKQVGFLVYHPLRNHVTGRITGLVYAPFRAGDLHAAALETRNFPLEIQTRDREVEKDGVLYSSPGFDPDGSGMDYSVERQIAIAGRVWQMTMQATPRFTNTAGTPFAWITALTSLLLATAIAAAARWQLQSADRTRELVALQEKTLRDKDLMLQEMKHRIKNSIARILAIARQTAAASDTVEEFSGSFTERLQSMANAQDMLTRSHRHETDLRELVLAELNQVYGSAVDENVLEGPPVSLNGVQTQALGVTLHELATNSMKYGSGKSADGDLNVSWRIDDPGRGNVLVLDWRETTQERIEKPNREGFGTRLIDASITGDLGGRIDRRYGENGLVVEIRVPSVAPGS